MRDQITIVPAPDAPAGRADPTRRWALRFPDGAVRFAGVSRPEAERAAPALGALGPAGLGRALVEAALPVVVSDGAGPHLLDAAGRLTLALGPHPRLEGRIAMGEPSPRHRIGLVRPVEAGVWRWAAVADVDPAGRVPALDALDALEREASVPDWERRWADEASAGAVPERRGAW